jgi:hypothetical protein
MSLISEVPFHHGHIMLLGQPQDGWITDPVRTFGAQARAGLAITLLIDGRVACCGGIARLWPGLGEAWMLPAELARSKPLALTRTAHRFIDRAMIALSLHRVQCFCQTLDNRAVRWAPALGFQREGTLRRYGTDGTDYEVFSIVR